MISVEEALSRIIAGLAERAPVAAEDILLSAGLGRVRATPCGSSPALRCRAAPTPS